MSESTKDFICGFILTAQMFAMMFIGGLLRGWLGALIASYGVALVVEALYLDYRNCKERDRRRKLQCAANRNMQMIIDASNTEENKNGQA